jgi:hypothetical protein
MTTLTKEARDRTQYPVHHHSTANAPWASGADGHGSPLRGPRECLDESLATLIECKQAKDMIMHHKQLCSAILATFLVVAPVSHAFSQGLSRADLESLQYDKTVIVPVKKIKSKEGKSFHVHIVKMRGETMALVPLDALKSAVGQAEGHSVEFSD